MKVRTSVLKGFALLALSTFTFAACEDKTQPPPPPAVTVAVVPATMTLQVGQTGPMVAIVSNAANTNVTWATSSASVATVSATGVVTAVGPGTAVITATSSQDPNARGAGVVTVNPGPITIVAIDLVPNEASIPVTGTVQMVSLVTGTPNTAVTYSSSAATVATVNASGLVTGVAAGTAVITATSVADPTKRDASVITVTSGPIQTVTISITPTQGSVSVGGTQQFVGLVQGSTNTAVTYSSSTPGVATINATTGLATGVAPGTTVITATAAANPNARATATLTVLPQAPPPSVSIQSVTPIGANNTVAGQITAVANVSADVSHDVRSVEFRIDGQPVCTQTFSQPLGTTQGVAQISCPINTAELDANGNPRFPNGPRVLTVVAINGAGTVVAQATYPTLNFANPNLIDATVTWTASAIGTDGFMWNRGDATIRVIPQLFQGGSLAAVTVGLDLTCNGVIDVTATANQANNYTVVFARGTDAAPGALYAVAHPGVCFRLGSAQTTTGQPLTFTATGLVVGPGTTYRVDNANPSPPATVGLPGGAVWVGTGFTFTSTAPGASAAAIAAATVTGVIDNPPCFNGAGTVDETGRYGPSACTLGSGVTSVQFFAVPSVDVTTADTPENNAAIIAGRTSVTASSQLSNTQPNALRLFVSIRDAVGNIRVFRGGLFGVDLETPTFDITAGPVNHHINPNTDQGVPSFTFEMTDDVSDFPANPIQVRITRNFGMGAVTCYNVNTKALIVDASANAVPAPCPWVTLTGFNFDMSGLPEGLFEVSMRVTDRAGNISAVQSQWELIDATAPVVQVASLVVNTAAHSVSVTGSASDSVALRGHDLRLQFATAPIPTGATSSALPVGAFDQYNSFQAVAPSSSSTANRILARSLSGSAGIWRSLQLTGAGDVPVAVVYPISGAGFMSVDLGRNWAEAFGGFTSTAGDGMPADLQTFSVSVSSTISNGVSRQEGSALWGTSIPSGTPTSRSVTATATGPAGTMVRPFTVVHFYRVDAEGAVYWIGSTSTVTVADAAVRTYDYSVTFSASGLPADTDQEIFAVGVQADSDALRTAVDVIQIHGSLQPRT